MWMRKEIVYMKTNDVKIEHGINTLYVVIDIAHFRSVLISSNLEAFFIRLHRVPNVVRLHNDVVVVVCSSLWLVGLFWGESHLFGLCSVNFAYWIVHSVRMRKSSNTKQTANWINFQHFHVWNGMSYSFFNFVRYRRDEGDVTCELWRFYENGGYIVLVHCDLIGADTRTKQKNKNNNRFLLSPVNVTRLRWVFAVLLWVVAVINGFWPSNLINYFVCCTKCQMLNRIVSVVFFLLSFLLYILSHSISSVQMQLFFRRLSKRFEVAFLWCAIMTIISQVRSSNVP